MKDCYGDRIRVKAGLRVYVLFVDKDDIKDDFDMSLSPTKARKFAKKLIEAADEVERYWS